MFLSITFQSIHSKQLINVETQTTVTIRPNMDVDMSSNILQAYMEAYNDGNNDRCCYELKQRSMKLDHMYNSVFQPLLESTPVKMEQTPQSVRSLANIYNSTDTSTTTEIEELSNCDSDPTYENTMSTTCTSTDIETTSIMESDQSITPEDDDKGIVFESCLKELLSRFLECEEPVCEQRFTYEGTNVTVTMSCRK